MAVNPINPPLAADLPENWINQQIISANGTDVGLSEKHGYNYLMKQVNAAQNAANLLGEAIENIDIGGSALFSATIGTTWDDNPLIGTKTQTVAVPGVTADMDVMIQPDYTGDGSEASYAAYVQAANQFLENISNGVAVTVEGGITFTIFGDPNDVTIPISIKEV